MKEAGEANGRQGMGSVEPEEVEVALVAISPAVHAAATCGAWGDQTVGVPDLVSCLTALWEPVQGIGLQTGDVRGRWPRFDF